MYNLSSIVALAQPLLASASWLPNSQLRVPNFYDSIVWPLFPPYTLRIVVAGNRCNFRFGRGLDHVRKRTVASISFDTLSRMTGVFGVVTQYHLNIVFFLLFEGGCEGGIFVSEFTLYRSPRCTMYVLSSRLPFPWILTVGPRITPRLRRPAQGSSANRESWKHLIFPFLGTLTRF
jgi:hypothetical protein